MDAWDFEGDDGEGQIAVTKEICGNIFYIDPSSNEASEGNIGIYSIENTQEA